MGGWNSISTLARRQKRRHVGSGESHLELICIVSVVLLKEEIFSNTTLKYICVRVTERWLNTFHRIRDGVIEQPAKQKGAQCVYSPFNDCIMRYMKCLIKRSYRVTSGNNPL